jgi:hypothetical protein
MTREAPLRDAGEMLELGRALLVREPLGGPVRLLGLGVACEHGEADGRQLGLL